MYTAAPAAENLFDFEKKEKKSCRVEIELDRWEWGR